MLLLMEYCYVNEESGVDDGEIEITPFVLVVYR
jgi:hypothetical protein